ncbi:MAG: hypothetical protein H0Z25_04725 [Kosmotoga sp.]|uniref:hypothetical protein n=1 Tax=Kosmotoga sp. TaxID=1955248 RepID=UPI001E1936FB|nr:hypothetical protein [Kosmotoga sp.]MBO8166506.1 hypothetical protein [Kosmotoga sp.]
MARLFLLLVVSSIVILAAVVFFYIFLQPVEVGVLATGRVSMPKIDLSDFEKPVELKDYFQPLMADSSLVIKSMMEAGVEATSVTYKGYFKINNIEYAVLKTGEDEKLVRVGDSISKYLVYGITEFAVLLNDLDTNEFAIARNYEEKK